MTLNTVKRVLPASEMDTMLQQLKSTSKDLETKVAYVKHTKHV